MDMSSNSLSELSFVKDLYLLENLDMSYNNILMVSVMDVRRLDKLKVLKLRGNRLTSLSFMLMTLPSLMHIDVSGMSVMYISLFISVDSCLLY